MNFYEHHLGDYIRDAAHLSLLEEGAYRRLIDAYYVRERELPAERPEVYKLARAVARPERKAVDYVLDTFFQLTDAGWWHKRCQEEIDRYRAKSETARLSANARWSRSGRNANASADAMRTHPERMSNAYANRMLSSPQSPVPSPQTPETNHQTDVHVYSAWEEAKRAYPPTAGRQDWITGQRNFMRRAGEGTALEQLIDGARRYAAYVEAGGVSNTKFVLSPGRFFGDDDRPWSQDWPLPATRKPTAATFPTTAELEERERAKQRQA